MSFLNPVEDIVTLPWWRTWKVLTVVAAILCLVVVHSCQSRETLYVEALLVKEVTAIQPVAGSRIVCDERHRTARSVYILQEYHSDKEFEGIKNHYIAEFERNGWTYNSQQKLPPRYRDGFDGIVYCKGEFAATLDHVVNNAPAATYSVVWDWRFTDCHEVRP